MNNEKILEIQDLYFNYPHGKKIFEGINFSMNKGDKVALVGSNGSGKTTLFHLIMGLLKPDKGDIYIFNKKRTEEKDFFEVRQRIGLLFQDSDDQLFCPTVQEDIAFGPLNLGKSKEEVRLIVKETCEKLGISGMEKRVTYKLSGGEKRLVAFATLIAMNPECLLLDEPTAGLDEETSNRILGYLKNHVDSYVIVSHDHEFLRQAVKKTYLLKEGKIQTI